MSSKLRFLLPATLIVVAAGWVYAPAVSGGWLWDDNLYITENPLLKSAGGLGRIWFAPSGINYFPITSTLQWLQWQLWGVRTLGYHLTNIGLHLTSAFLFWRLLGKLGVRWGWLGGLLFTVHPVAVESVAWISEAKNTLSLPPLLLAMLAYVDFDGRGRRRDYVWAWLWFLIAMLCKSTVAMFPLILLLYAWWKHGRLRVADAKRSVAFFAVSIVLGSVTVWFEHHQMINYAYGPMGGLLSRLAGAGLAVIFYFSKSVFPAALLPIYPQWRGDPPTLSQFWPWLVMGAGLGWFWRERLSWGRHVLLGLGWLALNFAPVLGFIGMAYLRISRVADHFAYVSLLGPIGLTVAAVGGIKLRSPPGSVLLWSVVAAAAAVLAFESHRYAGVFISQDRLWNYTLQRNPGSWVAHFNLANVRREQGRLPEAIGQYRRALQIKSDLPEVRDNLGYTLAETGRVPEAIAQYEEALRVRPDFPDAHGNLGLALLKAGRQAEAIAHLERAAKLRPDAAEVQTNLGLALASAGRQQEAAIYFERALQLNSGSAEVHDSIGVALAQAGRLSEAIAQYQTALRLRPDFPEAQDNLGAALLNSGRTGEAIAHFDQALKLRPEFADAHNNLAVALADTGRIPEAIVQYREVLRLKPDLFEAHFNLGNALAESSRLPEAIAEYREALRLNPNDAEAHYNLGVALRALGSSGEAKAQFEEATRLQARH